MIEREQHGGRRKVKEALHPSHEEKRRFDEPRQWLAAKQNLARLSSIDQRGEEEEQQQEQRQKTCLDSDEVYSFLSFLFFSYFCNPVYFR